MTENTGSIKRDATAKLHEDIKKEYHKLKGVKKFGVPMYTSEYITHALADKFYKSPRTIINIVYHS